MKKLKRDEKAVSPVIGVMLMIVVTVILAASVSSFSSSVTQVEKAPIGVFQAEILKAGGWGDHISFRYLSGDRIPSSELTMIFIANGTMTEVLPNSVNTKYNWYGKDYNYTSPWKFVPGSLPSDHPEVNFGNYTIMPGITFKGNYAMGATGTDDVHAMIKNWDDLTTDSIVTVKMVHNPSGRVIWQADVSVTG